MSKAPQRDTIEFAAGVLLGAALGAGVALLAAPDRSPRARFTRRIRKRRQRVGKQARQTRQATGRAAQDSTRLARETGSFFTEFARALREELLSEGLRQLRRSIGSRSDPDPAHRPLRERIPLRRGR